MRKTMDGPIKIGYTSSDAIKRMGQLQTGHHEQLYLLGTIPGVMSDEKAIHKELAEYNIHGEWFEAKPELLEVIKDVIENQRSWYYFRQVKFNKVDIECRGLKALVVELRQTIKTLEEEKEQFQQFRKEFVNVDANKAKIQRRINREVGKRKELQNKINELEAKLAETIK
jgi:gamma-glutamylcyclotransferase (GGCT)/AIG2-like uncharacterized protein YtfP